MTETIEVLQTPTTERLRHGRHMHVDAPLVDQRVERRAWRLVNVVEIMHRKGKIDDRRWSAWERFERDWNRASIAPSIIAKYGERAGVGGTPVSQMTAEALSKAGAMDDWRMAAIDRVSGALLATTLPRIQRAMVMVVSEECNLEQIGRAICSLRSREQCIAVAGAAIEDGLWLIYQYYQRLYGQAQVAP